MPELRLENVAKFFKVERKKQMAVADITLTIEQGEFVFINGSGGSGKSTILHLLGGEILPDKGNAYLNNVNMTRFFGPWHQKLRRTFGIVWQEPRLLRKSSVGDNLLLTAAAGGVRKKNAPLAVAKALALVGMSGAEQMFPGELAIGQVRRVELAKALVASPPVLLLDELTAQLDDDTIWDVFHLLDELNRKGTTVVMVTHAAQFVNIMRRRVLTLVDGHLAGDVRNGRYGQTMAKTVTVFSGRRQNGQKKK